MRSILEFKNLIFSDWGYNTFYDEWVDETRIKTMI